MQWNHPRAARVKASRVTEVHLKKDTYSGRDLGEKKKSIPFYDPRPTNRRFVNPEAVARLRNDLERVEEKALAEDKSGKIKMYGSSCWLKLLEPSPVPSSDDSECDEGSSSESDNERQMGVPESSCEAPVPMAAIDPESPADFYEHRVAVSSARAAEIARETKGQSTNLSWYNERRLRVTATLVKSIASRRSDDFSTIINRKLAPPQHPTAAMKYGLAHERDAVKAYITRAQTSDVPVVVESCGLFIHPTKPWLSASPDGLVMVNGKLQRVVEIKCPFTMRNGMSLREFAGRRTSCLTDVDGN
eukprot:scpid67927/ scgid34113/ 